MYIVFDTETTGKAKNFSAPVNDFNNWPRMVQIAWKVFDKNGVEIDSQNLIIKPNGFTIPQDAIAIHRISNEIAKEKGIPLSQALDKFSDVIRNNKYLIAHNINFDKNVVGCEYLREGKRNCLSDIEHIDTMTTTIDFVAIPNTRRGGFKYPSMTELHKKLFGVGFDGAHDALVDVSALAKCFFKLQEIGVLGFKDSEDLVSVESLVVEENKNTSENLDFVHLGLHTYHSILEGAGSAQEYINLAIKNGQKALGVTDISTLSGTFDFYNKCKSKGIKPILGVEMFLNDNIGKFEDKNYEGDSFGIKIFIKNTQGYQNLNRLLYLANTDGYYKQGRIKTDWLLENKEGLIITTSGIDGKISSLISMGREVDAEKYFNMLSSNFGEDLFIELKINKFSEQKRLNNFLLRMVKKYGNTPILTNDTFYPGKSDSILQDVVTSLKQQRAIPFASLKENRELWYFTYSDFLEMNSKYEFNYPKKFIDFCLENTKKLAEKCNFDFETGIEKYPRYEPTEDVISYFGTDVPEEIIKKLAFAKLKQKIKKYQENGLVEMTEEKIKEYVDRLNYEIHVIESKKMLDYFLVNWEIINFYRKQGYTTGPARGSAAGSLLSWCLDITKIDPIRFDLYFERFLNPERNCLTENCNVMLKDGSYKNIVDVEVGDPVQTEHGLGTLVQKHERELRDDEDVYEIESEDGAKVQLTGCHIVPVFREGKRIEIRVDEILETDYLFIF